MYVVLHPAKTRLGLRVVGWCARRCDCVDFPKGLNLEHYLQPFVSATIRLCAPIVFPLSECRPGSFGRVAEEIS